MKISELIAKLQYVQRVYELPDIDVAFYTGGKYYLVGSLDLATICQSHLKEEERSEDFNYILFRGASWKPGTTQQ